MKILVGTEPKVTVSFHSPLRYYGNHGYGGWSIPDSILNSQSTVVDVGLGEDISFSEALIEKFNLEVHGLDPTPKSISYICHRSPKNFHLHQVGLSHCNKKCNFYLPNNANHVSGSTIKSSHLSLDVVEVDLIDISSLFDIINISKIDLLKMDIEGSEYEVINSASFHRNAFRIGILCIEFHHRWKEFGINATYSAVETLSSLGFVCIWKSLETNEEFTFINKSYFF